MHFDFYRKDDYMEISYSRQATKSLTKQDRTTPWDDIEEVSPDEWDLQMLDDINKNPDCHKFVSQDELLKELNLNL